MDPDDQPRPPSGLAVPARLPAGLARLRRRHDRAASAGAQPHVTVLYPFIPCASLTPDVRDELAVVAAGVDPFTVWFTAVRRFEGVVWIEPEPADPFLALTAAVVARWPDYPPYGGIFDSVVAHLTIAEFDVAPLAEIEAEAARYLPFSAAAERLELWCQDDLGVWRPRWRWPLGHGGPRRPVSHHNR